MIAQSILSCVIMLVTIGARGAGGIYSPGVGAEVQEIQRKLVQHSARLVNSGVEN